MFRSVFVVLNPVSRTAVNHLSKRIVTRRSFQSLVISQSSHSHILALGDAVSNRMTYCSLHSAEDPTEQTSKENLNEEALQDQQYPIFNNINYEEIAGNDEDLLDRLNDVVAQMRSMASQNQPLPTQLKRQQWLELVKLRSFSSRLKLVRFFFINEMKRLNKRIRKEKRRKLLEERAANINVSNDETGVLRYGLSHNSLFLRIYDTTIDKVANWAVLQAMMFEPKIIIDCSYDQYMVQHEKRSCLKQLVYLFSKNRTKPNPVDIHFVNFNPESDLAKGLQNLMPTLYEPHFPFNWSSESYDDLFPKEKLVYLTPHCEETLETISHDDIYIIGAMVDRGVSEPLSLTKARRSGVRYAKLPLDDFVDWGTGGKSLTVDQCVNIIADTLHHGSWEKSLKTWIPPRKLKKSTIEEAECEIRKKHSAFHLKDSHRRNMLLYEVLHAELEGEKGKKFKGQWPQQ